MVAVAEPYSSVTYQQVDCRFAASKRDVDGAFADMACAFRRRFHDELSENLRFIDASLAARLLACSSLLHTLADANSRDSLRLLGVMHCWDRRWEGTVHRARR